MPSRAWSYRHMASEPARVGAYDLGLWTCCSVRRILTKQYGLVTALDHVSFEIGATVTGLLGPNGAGKSTAIKLFLGLTRPTSGRAEVLGQEAGRDEQVRARLGYMPEHDCLPSAVSAAEFLTHMAETSGLPPRHARIRAADTLRHVGLFEERYRQIGGYSTGMKQRVKLAQALVHDPVLGAARRAHRRTRSAGARGDACADSQDAPGVRDQRRLVVSPDGRCRAHVRAHPRARARPGPRGGRNVDVHRGVRDALHRGHSPPTGAGSRRSRSAT